MVTSFKRSHVCTAMLSAPNPAAGHHQPTPLPETPGHSQASLSQSLVGSLLLSPGTWCTQGYFFVPSKCLFPQSCVSSISSVIKSHWPPKSNSLGVFSPFARSPGWEICCGSQKNTDLPQSLRGLWVLMCTRLCLKPIMAPLFVSDSLPSLGLQPIRFLYPWNFPGKNTGVGCHSLLQGIFLTQGSNPGLLHCRQILYHLSHQRSPWQYLICLYPKESAQIHEARTARRNR